MKNRKKRIVKKCVEIWTLNYQIIIPVFITGICGYVCWKYNIHFWESKYYGDMLTAVITFLSIVISVFGILIPTVFSNKNKMVSYFIKNIDSSYFIKSIKYAMISGISEIVLICVLYTYDILPIKCYILVCIISLFGLIYFLCGAYKYISLLLRLVLEEKEPYEGKKFSSQVSEGERKAINEMLRNNKN